MKHRILGAALLATALVTAGCSDDSGGDGGGGDGSSGPVNISFESLAWQPDSIKANKDIVAAWNDANPDIQVEYVQGDWGSIGDQLTTQFQAGKAPDVFHFYDGGLQQYAARGNLVDLDDYLSDDFKSSISDASWENVSFDGLDGVWGVPFLQEPTVIYANKQMLEDAGVRIPTIDEPWSWDEFQDAAVATTDAAAGVYGAAVPLKDGGVDNTISMGLSFGAEYFGEDGSSVQWGEAETEVPTRLHSMLYDDQSMSTDVLGLTATDTIPLLFEKKTAMIFGGSFIRQQFSTDAPKDLDWITLPPPVGTSQEQSNGAQTLSIAANSEHPEEAAEFLQFFLNAENQAKLAMGDWLTPTSVEAGEVIAEKEGSNLGWDVVIAQSANLVQGAYQRAAGYEEFVSKVAGPTFTSYYKDEISIDEVGDTLVDEGDPILERAATR